MRDSVFDLVCGVESSGIPLATAISLYLEKPLIYVRKGRKGHGLGKLIEGDYREGALALLVDDVATTGNSLVHGVKALRSEGLRVQEAFVLVDREQGALEALTNLGVKLRRLTSLSAIVSSLFRSKKIGKETYEDALRHLRS